MNTELFQSIKTLILDTIESEAIDPSRVRQIIIGMSRDGQSINLWQQESWDNYNEYDDEASIGEISNIEWLDKLDRISFGDDVKGFEDVTASAYLPNLDIQLNNPAQQALYARHLTLRIQEIKAVLVKLAIEQALGKFDCLVGLMAQNISNSRYADLVAIYHPLGTELISGSERRLPGYSSIYGEMACTEKGLIHFYPKSDRDEDEDDDDNQDDKSPATSRWFNHYLFTDIDTLTVDDDEIVIHLHTTDQFIELEGGHTNEEWGGPGRKEVGKIIIAHFQKHVPHLFFDDEDMPAPSDKTRWENWLALYEKNGNKKSARTIGYALEKGNLEGALQFHALLTLTEKEQIAIQDKFANYYLEKNEYEKVVQVIEGIASQKSTRIRTETYYRALLMVGETKKVIDLAQHAMATLEVTDPIFSSNASFHYLAGFIMGQTDGTALDRVEEGRTKVNLYQLALALQVYPTDIDQAKTTFQRFLQAQDYTREVAEVDLNEAPELLALALTFFSKFDNKIVYDGDILGNYNPSDVKKLNSAAAHLADWRESKPQECLTRQEITEEFNKDPRISSVLVQTPEETWVKLSNNGLAMLSTDNQHKVEFLHQIPDIKADTLVVYDSFLFVSVRADLYIYSLNSDATLKPTLHSHQILCNDQYLDTITVTDDLLAVSSGHEIEIYDATDKTNLRLLTLINVQRRIGGKYTSCSSLLLKGDILYMAMDDLALYAIDLKTPESPKILSAAALTLSSGCILESNNCLAIYNKHNIHFYDIRDPKNISGVALEDGSEGFEFIFPKEDQSKGLSFIIGNRNFFWFEYLYNQEQGLTLSAARPLFEVEGNEFERLYDVETLVETDPGYLAIQSDESYLLNINTMPAYPQWGDDVKATVQQNLKNWLSEKCAEFHKDQPNDSPGLVIIESSGDDIEFHLAHQRSLPHIGMRLHDHSEDYGFKTVTYTTQWETLFDKPLPTVDKDSEVLRDEKDSADLFHKKAISINAIQQLIDTDAFKQAIPNRAYLATRFEYVFDVLRSVNEDKPWQPIRREIKGVVTLSLSEKLSDYSSWNSYAEKVSDSEKLKSELYALGRTGDKGALQVIRRRFRVDTDDAISVFLDVILNLEQYSWMTFLDDFTDREDVKTVYLEVYNKLMVHLNKLDRSDYHWSDALVESALGLGFQDKPELDPLLDFLLVRDKHYHTHYDQASMLLEGKKDLAPYGELIKKTIDGMQARDNRMPKLAQLLFRAGIYEPPADLLEQSKREKNREQYSDKKIGIKSLDRHLDEQEDVCQIERTFTAKIVCDRLNELILKKDLTTPLWPETIEPEPYPSSWKFFLQSLLKQIELNENFEHDLDELVRHLNARLKEGDAYSSDREMFKALFRMLVESREQIRFAKMIETVKNNIGAIGEEDFDKLNSLRENAEVNMAWQANQDEDRDSARTITTRLLAEGVQNWHIFFLDARLKWLASGDPAQAIDAGTKHLEAKLHGGSGKALLLNLVGCAHDELKQYPDALRCFQEASNNDPEQIIFSNNIAEIHHKTGEPIKAQEWAREAKRRGSKADIIATILDGASTDD